MKERRKEGRREIQLCHIESLHSARVVLTADVLRTAITETHCTRENKGNTSV